MKIPAELRIQNRSLKYGDCNNYQKTIYRQIALQLEAVRRWDKMPKGKDAANARREDIGVLKFLMDRFDEYADISPQNGPSGIYERGRRLDHKNPQMSLGLLLSHLSDMCAENCKDIPVSIMEEHEVDGRTIQFSSNVTDAACTEDGVVIIGQELP
jgi:hypothetical protein